jgi:hypothetical protein
MKKTWNAELLHGMQNLSEEECTEIVGGESLWYWVGLAAGGIFYMYSYANGDQSAGQKLMNAAL